MIIEFQSAATGVWYTHIGSTNKVSAIKIDGVLFTPELPECQHEWQNFSDPGGDWLSCKKCCKRQQTFTLTYGRGEG